MAAGPGSRTPTRQMKDGELAASRSATVELDTANTAKLPVLGRRAKTPTIKPTAQTIRALTTRPTTGGAYSMTNKTTTRPPAERPAPAPAPVSFEVTANGAGSVRLDLDGRSITLTRRDARALADKLLRAIK